MDSVKNGIPLFLSGDRFQNIFLIFLYLWSGFLVFEKYSYDPLFWRTIGNADYLYLEAFFRDISEYGFLETIRNWVYPPSLYFFPDSLIYGFSAFISPISFWEPNFEIIQIVTFRFYFSNLLWELSLGFLIYKTFPTGNFPKIKFYQNPIISVFLVFFTGLHTFALLFPEYAESVMVTNHRGAGWLFFLFLFLVRRKSIPLYISCPLIFLGGFSDPLFFFILATTFALNFLIRKSANKIQVIFLIFAGIGSSFGYYLVKESWVGLNGISYFNNSFPGATQKLNSGFSAFSWDLATFPVKEILNLTVNSLHEGFRLIYFQMVRHPFLFGALFWIFFIFFRQEFGRQTQIRNLYLQTWNNIFIRLLIYGSIGNLILAFLYAFKAKFFPFRYLPIASLLPIFLFSIVGFGTIRSNIWKNVFLILIGVLLLVLNLTPMRNQESKYPILRFQTMIYEICRSYPNTRLDVHYWYYKPLIYTLKIPKDCRFQSVDTNGNPFPWIQRYP
jgi:hypothetical protein